MEMYNSELKLFQRSYDSIWTDEYISNSLLKAQLDESTDAGSRKYSNRKIIVDWINSKIKINSKIIDLGCGPGLYARDFGIYRHGVTGIDFNEKSINYAKRNKSLKGLVEYKCLNYLKDKIEGKFNAAMMIFCDFGALTPTEQKKMLLKIKNMLTDDGMFIFDVFGKSEFLKQKNEKIWYISNGKDFWSKEPYFLMKETKLFGNEYTTGTRYYLVNQKNGKIKEFIIWDQYYDENSINGLLLKNGFDIVEINRDIIKYNEETLLITAKKKKL